MRNLESGVLDAMANLVVFRTADVARRVEAAPTAVNARWQALRQTTRRNAEADELAVARPPSGRRRR